MRDALIDIALAHKRSILLIMFGIIVFGVVARLSIPTESEPRVEIPYFVITVVHEGISPEDALRLLVRPLEIELKALDDVKEVTGTGAEHVGYIAVEFHAAVDIDVALADVREAVNRAKPELPSTAEEPVVTETASTNFPVLQVNLVSEIAPERLVTDLAKKLKDQLESVPLVHTAVIQGHREELLEIAVEPAELYANQLSLEQLVIALARNNQLIPAGSLDTYQGSVALKIPSVVENAQHLLQLPVFVDGDTVVTLADIATVRRAFKDRTNYTRNNGKETITVFVYRRVGANTIEAARQVRAAVAAFREGLPSNVEVFISRDASTFDEQQITELEGNIVTALFLVLAVVIPSVGIRSSLIVALTIPVSFLFAMIFLWLLDYSFNFMVMFGMLMSLGMLIDGAIIVSEDAERRIALGIGGEEAYGSAAKRMFTPVIASTATTLAAFMPLLFWPGTAGQYMGYLPVTVLMVLIGSLLFTLIFVPTLGSTLAARTNSVEKKAEVDFWLRDLTALPRISAGYVQLINYAARYPFVTLIAIVAIVYGIFTLFGARDQGVILFSENDPMHIQINVRASGNLDLDEAKDLVLEVESIVLAVPEIRSVNTYVSNGLTKGAGQFARFQGGSSADVIGTMFLETHDAKERARTGQAVIDELRANVNQIGGISVEVRAYEGFLTAGKPIFVQVTSRERELLMPVVTAIRAHMDAMEGLDNIEDTLPLPGFEWQLTVDREKAARFGADVTAIGLLTQLVTEGAKLGEYRPNDSDKPLDIRIRFTEANRALDRLDELQLATPGGSVPISNFVSRQPVSRQDTMQRRDQQAMHVVQADVLAGFLADAKSRELQGWIERQQFDDRVNIRFRSAAEDEQESVAFVTKAFSFALLLMFVLLVTQFNSVYQSLITIFAVVLSTAGVFLGLVITGQPFSAVLSGVGIIALSGIVVNNSIVLIDTYNIGRREHPDMLPLDVVIRTGLQRLRPVLLTTITTMIGLLPLASHQSIDFINRTWTTGSTLSNYWVPLAQAVAFGLGFATILTLIVTPAMLVLPNRFKDLNHTFIVEPLAQWRTKVGLGRGATID
ncbi:MAG: efflux RND transporter permease subunit [Gammaproteobacteria bacterium]|nr:efflux RND transporter permease subunit [Gammaproteobacteria bacterium]